jgi:hypothetical protein
MFMTKSSLIVLFLNNNQNLRKKLCCVRTCIGDKARQLRGHWIASAFVSIVSNVW